MTVPCPAHLFLPLLLIHPDTAQYLGHRQSICRRLCVAFPILYHQLN